jgi:hypothetical protein
MSLFTCPILPHLSRSKIKTRFYLIYQHSTTNVTTASPLQSAPKPSLTRTRHFLILQALYLTRQNLISSFTGAYHQRADSVQKRCRIPHLHARKRERERERVIQYIDLCNAIFRSIPVPKKKRASRITQISSLD